MSGEYTLVNAFDDVVKTNVRKLMESMDMCQCEKCYFDACAIVFNNRYTHFVTTRQGMLLAKVPAMNHGNHIDLVVEITNALQLVKNSPKH